MKKMIATVLTAGLVFFGASSGLAMEEETQNGNAYGTFNFWKKLAKHDDMTVAEVQEMYVKHHGTLGAAPSKNFTKHDGCMAEE